MTLPETLALSELLNFLQSFVSDEAPSPIPPMFLLIRISLSKAYKIRVPGRAIYLKKRQQSHVTVPLISIKIFLDLAQIEGTDASQISNILLL